MSWPSNHTDPDVNGSSPDSARIVVVLPAPLEPNSVTSLPSCTFNEMPCRARILPYCTTMSRTSSRTGLWAFCGSLVCVIGHPQVRRDDLGVLADLGWQAVGDLAAELQHDDAVGDTHDQSHVVLDEQHGVAVVADLLDQLDQRGLLAGVEA